MDYQNLVELHRRQADRLGPHPAVRHKRHGLYYEVSWADYREQALACAAALVNAGIEPGDRVGLLAENRLAWLLADMGIMTAGAVNVPPHAPLTARQVQYQWHDAGVSWAFVSTAEQLAKVQQVRADLPQLRGVVVFDPNAVTGDCQSWRGFLQRGRALLPKVQAECRRREADLTKDSLATIMYTSGTTGEPKGVMLTHDNLLSNAIAVNEACPRNYEAVLLSWLPYSHIYARTVDHYLSIVAGVVLCIAESAETVVANLAEIHPTHMSCVPRFYEKVLAAVSAHPPEAASKILKGIFGPRIEWLTSGGAPLPIGVARAYQDAGLLVLQGYGLTECAPVISFNTPENYKLETVGQAIPGVEVKIADDGEILTRGPHVMPGYWNNDAATTDAVRDGWLYTGDLGHLDEEGYLSITGRKKELMVLSNGKKIVPPFIEGLVLADPCIDQVVVFGEGKNYLTALVVPQWDNLRQALQEQGVACDKTDQELAEEETTLTMLQQRIDQCLQDVSSAERVKKFVVLPKPLTVESEELTVSLKLRRGVIYDKYQQRIEEMYPS